MLKDKVKGFYIRHVLRKQVPISFDKNNTVSFLDAEPLTTGQVYCVINFDDLSPLPDKSRFIGRGGSKEDFVSLKQMELLKQFPFLGITHFMIPQFLPSDHYYLINRKQFSIINHVNREWLDYYKSLMADYNVEIASHGVYHRQAGNPLFARHTEFAYLDYKESVERLKLSLRIFHEAGFNPIGFRAPGWDMNSDLSLIDAIADTGFKYAGLSSYDGGLNAVKQRVHHFHPVFIKGIINFPDNINIDWPFEKIKETIDKIIRLNGIIVIKGHFSKHILTNSLSETNYLKLVETVRYIRREYSETVKFATFADVYSKLAADNVTGTKQKQH